jgi:hypothetical protein
LKYPLVLVVVAAEVLAVVAQQQAQVPQVYYYLAHFVRA